MIAEHYLSFFSPPPLFWGEGKRAGCHSPPLHVSASWSGLSGSSYKAILRHGGGRCAEVAIRKYDDHLRRCDQQTHTKVYVGSQL